MARLPKCGDCRKLKLTIKDQIAAFKLLSTLNTKLNYNILVDNIERLVELEDDDDDDIKLLKEDCKLTPLLQLQEESRGYHETGSSTLSSSCPEVEKEEQATTRMKETGQTNGQLSQAKSVQVMEPHLAPPKMTMASTKETSPVVMRPMRGRSAQPQLHKDDINPTGNDEQQPSIDNVDPLSSVDTLTADDEWIVQIEEEGGRQMYECLVCLRKFKQYMTVKCHMKVHNNENKEILECVKCCTKFSDSDVFERHSFRCTGEVSDDDDTYGSSGGGSKRTGIKKLKLNSNRRKKRNQMFFSGKKYKKRTTTTTTKKLPKSFNLIAKKSKPNDDDDQVVVGNESDKFQIIHVNVKLDRLNFSKIKSIYPDLTINLNEDDDCPTSEAESAQNSPPFSVKKEEPPHNMDDDDDDDVGDRGSRKRRTKKKGSGWARKRRPKDNSGEVGPPVKKKKKVTMKFTDASSHSATDQNQQSTLDPTALESDSDVNESQRVEGEPFGKNFDSKLMTLAQKIHRISEEEERQNKADDHHDQHFVALPINSTIRGVCCSNNSESVPVVPTVVVTQRSEAEEAEGRGDHVDEPDPVFLKNLEKIIAEVSAGKSKKAGKLRSVPNKRAVHDKAKKQIVTFNGILGKEKEQGNDDTKPKDEEISKQKKNTNYTKSAADKFSRERKQGHNTKATREEIRTKIKVVTKSSVTGGSFTTYICPECSKSFDKENLAIIHIRRVHLKELVQRCWSCGLDFSDYRTLKTHNKNYHPVVAEEEK